MPTVNDYLVQLQKDKQNLVKAFSDRGVEVSSSDTFTSLASKSGGLPTGGGGEVSGMSYDDDVVFIDYDGELLYTYKAEDFLKLTSMPALKAKDGLIATNWNYDFDKAQTYVRLHGKLLVGQICDTPNGDLWVVIDISNQQLDPYLTLTSNGCKSVINWGDGTSDTVEASSDNILNIQHHYQQAGIYKIVVNFSEFKSTKPAIVNTNMRSLINNDAPTVNDAYLYSSTIKEVYVGSSLSGINGYTFYRLYNLSKVMLSEGIKIEGTYNFYYDHMLKAVIVPKSATTLGQYFVTYCFNVLYISFPDTLTGISSYFIQYCYALRRVSFPESLKSISTYTLTNCYSSDFNLITYGSSVATLPAYAFQYSYLGKRKLIIPDNVTKVNNSSFAYWYNLEEVEMSDKITAVEGFSNCQSLKRIYVSKNATTLGTFSGCYSLTEIKVPPKVVSIMSGLFGGCYSLQVVDMTEYTSIPRLQNTSAFSTASASCKIVVPKNLFNAWKTASNWVTFADRIWYIDDNGEYSQEEVA